MSGEETSELQQRTMKRVAARLMPALLILYIIAYLDRVNVTFAQDKLESDLGFSGAVYGFGAGVFFIAYFILEVPSNLALHKFGARKWIARIMLTWGIISACTALVKGPLSFYLVRFLLGMAEAGFFPGMILYLSYWFPARERARAVGFFMSAIAISYAIGAPISGGIMSVFDGVAGLQDWQWLFLLEAIPALIAGVCVWRFLTAIPYAVAIVGMIVIPRHSDRTGERKGVLAVCLGVAAVAFVASAVVSPVAAIAALAIGLFFLLGAHGVFWTMPAALLSGA